MITLTFPIRGDEEYLDKLMTFYCHTYNIMVKEARSRLTRLRRDPRYRKLMNKYKSDKKFTPEEKEELKSLRKEYGLSQSNYEKYLKKQNVYKIAHSAIVQKIAYRIWQATEKCLFDNGKEIRFKKRSCFTSFEAKSVKTGIKYINGHLEINRHCYHIFIRKNDTFAKESLKHKISFCRILRKWYKNKWRYYVQFIIDAPGKQISCANGTIGIDIGPSTIAVDSENGSFIQELNFEVESIQEEIKTLNQKIDTFQRKNNPQNYNPDGTIKRNTKSFKKVWNKSKPQIKIEHKRKDLYRLKHEKTILSQHILAKEILSLGNIVIIEDMQFDVLAKRAKETEVNKNGHYKSKKRFGKSILEHAPAQFLNILKYNIEKAGGLYIEVDCFKTAATQFDHTSGAFNKHKLNERFIVLDNGDIIQRDLHSAFNLRHIKILEDGSYEYDIESMNAHYADFKIRHNDLINDLKLLMYMGINIPSSIM